LNASGLSEATIKATKDNALNRIKLNMMAFAGIFFNRIVAIESSPLQN